jgi:hypothetical protein
MDIAMFKDILDNAVYEEGKWFASVAHETNGAKFVIGAEKFSGLRYAAVLLASGDQQLAESVLTEN